MANSSPALLGGSPLGSPENESATARAVCDMFAAVAPRYDFLNHFLSFGRDIAWRRATARALREVLARPESVAVDVCCGTGDLALALRQISAGKVMGTDFCHPMLVRAQAKARRATRSVFFVEADALSLPLRNCSVDALSVAFGFRNLANYTRGLEEFHRVLVPGGTVAILEFSQVRWPVFGPLFRVYFHRVLPRLGSLISGVEGPYQYLPSSVAQFPDQESLAGAMRAAGFENVRYRNFTGGVAALHLGEKGGAVA
jgi:demethylmenaquinone methyltransferase/2-methoxy-6-polyprenyl-1,4-benzoquinol methylase